MAVYVAHVPDVYHVPAEIKQPSWLPLVMAFKYPDPEKEPPVPVGAELEPVVVEVFIVVGAAAPDFGRYLMPEEAQLVLCPTGAAGKKVPV